MTKTDLLAVLAELKARCSSKQPLEGAPQPRFSSDWLSYELNAVPAVSSDQVTSLNALIAYVARQTGQNAYRIEREIVDQFQVPNLSCLPSEQYNKALAVLVERMPAQEGMA